MTNPAEPTFGHGEMIRAMRAYMGLSQRELARIIPMDRRTYQRIETEAEPCPTGFVDTMTRLVDTFDDEVQQTITTAEQMTKGTSGSVHFNVIADDDPAHVWTRAVIGRAAVESGVIVPELRPQELVTTQ
jgi:DNA-binding XRE family transcriptional regulator